jgi:hypothetical protein
VPVQSYIEDKTRQLLVIGTKNETLQVGKYYKLSIRFVGQLNDKLNGFYRASYTENGIKKYHHSALIMVEQIINTIQFELVFLGTWLRLNSHQQTLEERSRVLTNQD